MARVKYSCRNCNHQFIGDDYTQECPRCNSHSIERQGGDSIGVISMLQYFKDNKVLKYVVGGILLIVVILLLRECTGGCSSSDNGDTYSIIAAQKDDFIEVNVKRHTHVDGKKKKDLVKNPSTYLSAYQIKFKNGNRVVFQDGNRIYLCESENCVIEWDDSKRYPLNNPKTKSMVIPFDLGKRKPNKKAGCATKLEIIKVEPTNDCKMKVYTSLDSISTKKVLISINGLKGDFKAQRIWDAKGVTKINVWAYEDGVDTSVVLPCAAPQNNQSFYPHGCDPCTQEKKDELKVSFINICNSFVKDPKGEKGKMWDILAKSKKIIAKLDGERLGNDLSEFINEFKRISDNDKAKRCKINSSSIRINDNCEIIEFEFVSY